MSRVGWIDAGAGAAGDMLLGALVELDAVDPAEVVDRLGVRARVDVRPVRRGVLAATSVVVTPDADQPERHWADIRRLIDGADLPGAARDRAQAVFARLAVAEGRVHGVSPEQVHFHEVGAVDSLVDIVGACVGLARLGLDALFCGAVALGGGRIRTAHGSLPVPGPAVTALLADTPAMRVVGGPVEVELCTPTGAALLAEHVTAWGGSFPALSVEVVGAGAGTRELSELPNVLRLVVGSGEVVPAAPQLVLESNVDDLDPRLWPTVLERLLAAGAVDAWVTPILMKKGRPAHTVSALADPSAAPAVRAVLFAHTTSLGVREYAVAKHALDRTSIPVVIAERIIQVKIGLLDGRIVNVQPEWEDVVAAAAALDRPVKAVMTEALAAAGSQGVIAGAAPPGATGPDPAGP